MHITTKILFFIISTTAITLTVVGFIVPPTGIIDGSVLTAIGELMGFAALTQIPMLTKGGTDVTLQHGQTSITVNNPDKQRRQ